MDRKGVVRFREDVTPSQEEPPAKKAKSHSSRPPLAVVVLWSVVLSYLDYWEHLPLLSSPSSFAGWFAAAQMEAIRRGWVRELSLTTKSVDSKEVRICGKRHCETGPAVQYADGTKAWYLEGKRHRVGGPAVEYADGSKSWFLDGKQHRVDGPAVEYASGSKEWYLEDKRHRVDGPALEYFGTKAWYLEGKLHRVGEPAFEHASGNREWYLEGNRHRVGGPAVKYADGTKEWYLEGVWLSVDEDECLSAAQQAPTSR